MQGRLVDMIGRLVGRSLEQQGDCVGKRQAKSMDVD